MVVTGKNTVVTRAKDVVIDDTPYKYHVTIEHVGGRIVDEHGREIHVSS